LIGEIRDKETAGRSPSKARSPATWSSAPAHQNDAPGATARLIDMGVEPYLSPPRWSW